LVVGVLVGKNIIKSEKLTETSPKLTETRGNWKLVETRN